MLRRTGLVAGVTLAAAVSPATLSLAADIGASGDRSRFDEQPALTTTAQMAAMDAFRDANPLTGIMLDDSGLVQQIYGKSFTGGATPVDAAANAAAALVDVLRVSLDDLSPVSPVGDGAHVRGMMHDPETGEPKFWLAQFSQERDGVTVFRSRLDVLIRNEPGYPVVLIGSDIRPLDDFAVQADHARASDVPADVRAMVEIDTLPGQVTRYTEVKPTIFAGTPDRGTTPIAALQFVAETGSVAVPSTYRKELVVVDANTGELLYRENQVLDVDVTGTVSGRVTNGLAAPDCDPTHIVPLPYVQVNIGGNTAFTDAAGNFALTNFGSDPVTVESRLVGQYFEVFNQAQSDALLSETVTPPGPVDFVFNETNADERRLAEVNVYLESNNIRDWVLKLNPEYPVVGGQTGFDINVNINDNCNAFYNGSSINFFTAGGGCANTGYASVIYHEYGHHLVNVGGSGQGAYGEGMSDTVSALLLDDPRLGLGFNSGCSVPLRNADNNCQFQTSGCSSCGSAIHSCGQLLSGSVWDTRLELELTMGEDALSYVSQLNLNSILLHSGSSIAPDITIAFLTLDDDDDNILNGTPNYAAINAGFSAHNMPGPELALFDFTFPSGRPETVDPSGSTVLTYEVSEITGTLDSGSVDMFVSIDGGSFVSVGAMPMGGGTYASTFPGAECGMSMRYYFQATDTGGETETFPAGGASEAFVALSGFGVIVEVQDDFETNQGWTVTNIGLSDGQWTRGTPVGGGDRGDPPTDGDGSGQCWLTDNEDGNSDVDGGETILTSPLLDATEATTVRYYRWYSNTFGASPNADVFVVEVSGNGGATWAELEVVGPSGPEADGGWYQVEFDLATVPGFTPSDQFRIRFNASDLGDGSVVEAAVDGFELIGADCDDPGVPGDVDGDGDVDFQDIVALLAAWGPCSGCPADLDGNGTVDFTDLLTLLAAYGG